jgi:hypothetical protein
MKEFGYGLIGESMFKIKKCANCGQNQFNLLVDIHPSISCINCGQVYPHTVFKRLPDDVEAFRRMKISVQPDIKEIINVPLLPNK